MYPGDWTERLALNYGLSLANSASGGLSYAVGSARINARPDAAGNAATPTVKEQIDSFLAAGAPAEGDLVVVAAGISDAVTQGQLVKTGSLTAAGDVALYGRAGAVSVGSVSAGDDIVIRANGDVTASGDLKSGQSASTVGLGDQLAAATGTLSLFGETADLEGGVIDLRTGHYEAAIRANPDGSVLRLRGAPRQHGQPEDPRHNRSHRIPPFQAEAIEHVRLRGGRRL